VLTEIEEEAVNRLCQDLLLYETPQFSTFIRTVIVIYLPIYEYTCITPQTIS
jgi:hypothetical protein